MFFLNVTIMGILNIFLNIYNFSEKLFCLNVALVVIIIKQMCEKYLQTFCLGVDDI